ncbi:MAG: hypothetical protein ACP5NQ_07775, partial [Vulcanisaeta sp.]
EPGRVMQLLLDFYEKNKLVMGTPEFVVTGLKLPCGYRIIGSNEPAYIGPIKRAYEVLVCRSNREVQRSKPNLGQLAKVSQGAVPTNGVVDGPRAVKGPGAGGDRTNKATTPVQGPQQQVKKAFCLDRDADPLSYFNWITWTRGCPDAVGDGEEG